MRDLLKFREDFSREGIIISFNGSFTHGIIEEIGNAIKRHLESEKLATGTITDVFAVYVEQTQNVRNYLSRTEPSTGHHGSAIVVIIHNEVCYTVCSGNIIAKKDVPELLERLEKINSLDKDGLKKFYKEQLRRKIEPDSFGAGVGLIDMARRAYGKLEYKFETQNDEYDFFSLFVTVNGVLQ